MNNYPFERSPIVHPAGTVLSITVYGVIKHFGIATGYGTVIHASRRFGRVEETDFAVFCDGRPAHIHSLCRTGIRQRDRGPRPLKTGAKI